MNPKASIRNLKVHSPTLEFLHQALLKDPRFVRIFESIRQSSQGGFRVWAFESPSILWVISRSAYRSFHIS